MKQIYADVIVDISTDKLDRSFQYSIPESLRDKIQEGSKVRIPFGRGGRLIDGFVIGISEAPKIDRAKIKDIEECPDNYITAEEKLVRLAVWMKRTYGSTFISALKTVLPVREKKKVLEKRTVRSALPEKELKETHELWEKKHFTARARLLAALIEKKSISWEEAVNTCRVTAKVLRELEEKGIIAVESETAYRKGLPGIPDRKEDCRELDPQQEEVFRGIKSEFDGKNRPCLIRGVTGSGKTHIYMRLIRETIDKGRQAILLIPEISLTWQMVSRFYAVFGEKTAVLHSRLSQGERSDLIERVKNKEVSLVIGPRSALFTPFENLGIIIIDEEHDGSYQSEKTPRYNAREAALFRAKNENARLVLGSATPSLESRYRCETGEYALFELNSRYGEAVIPHIKIIDMREELKRGRKSIFSAELENAVGERLERKEQVMLFLNKRGHTGFISCRSCGEVIKCPHCDVSLTYHNNGKLMCHYCGYETDMVKNCPKCSSPYIGGIRIGTQQVEELLGRTFPGARVLRMDRDTVKAKNGYENILKDFAEKKADILVGTQMIVKGHDFPGVTLVGILAADASLYASDYRAAEETFQLLVQAVGRAGRKDDRGLGIIQTYSPDHYVIKAAGKQDYEAFYEEELANRVIMKYPPVSNLLVVHGSAKDEEKLQAAMGHIKNYLERIKPKGRVLILGPVKESIAKVNDMYKMAVYVKNADISQTIRMRQFTEKYISINSGFDDVNIQFALND